MDTPPTGSEPSSEVMGSASLVCAPLKLNRNSDIKVITGREGSLLPLRFARDNDYAVGSQLRACEV